MAFDYEKIKRKTEEANFWTSYADLYTALSVVFLFLYIGSSLRQGAAGFSHTVEVQKLTKRNQELEEQVKVYTTLKDDYLANQAKESEQEVYQKLMSKLSLLRDEAKEEKDELRKKAKENEEKEYALNQYQQIIRNIVDANIIAKRQINRRDTIITTKTEELSKTSQELGTVRQDLSETNQELAKTLTQKSRLVDSLEKTKSSYQAQINELQETQNEQLKSEREAFNRKLQATEMTAREKAKALEAFQVQARQTQAQFQAKISTLSQEIEQTEQQLTVAQQQAKAANQEKDQLAKDLEAKERQFQSQVAEMREAHETKVRQERAEFDKKIKSARMSAAQREAALKQFQARSKEAERDLQARISQLGSKLEGAEQENSRAVASVESLKKEREQLSGDLKRAQEVAQARRELIKGVKDALASAGVKAQVNEKTGDVIIDFGDDYFDTGKAELTPSMQEKLKKAFPAYARALLKNEKLSNEISNVEIVGFASSTFKGKYVDPQSLRPEDKDAVDYNLKLSFARANSIFKYLFYSDNVKFGEQSKLLPRMKVVGRGFLPEGKNASEVRSGMPEKEFCAKFDCKKAQRVIIKFNLKE